MQSAQPHPLVLVQYPAISPAVGVPGQVVLAIDRNKNVRVHKLLSTQPDLSIRRCCIRRNITSGNRNIMGLTIIHP